MLCVMLFFLVLCFSMVPYFIWIGYDKISKLDINQTSSPEFIQSFKDQLFLILLRYGLYSGTIYLILSLFCGFAYCKLFRIMRQPQFEGNLQKERFQINVIFSLITIFYMITMIIEYVQAFILLSMSGILQ